MINLFFLSFPFNFVDFQWTLFCLVTHSMDFLTQPIAQINHSFLDKTTHQAQHCIYYIYTHKFFFLGLLHHFTYIHTYILQYILILELLSFIILLGKKKIMVILKELCVLLYSNNISSSDDSLFVVRSFTSWWLYRDFRCRCR